MGQLMRLCGTQEWSASPVTDRIFAWAGDVSAAGQSVPLRVASALHALQLKGNPTLRHVYPPHSIDDQSLWQAISHVLQDEGSFIGAWLDSPPQTNEVRRSAVLIALGHWLTDRFNLPIQTSELGASAGLNLHWDRYALDIDGQIYGDQDPALTLSPNWSGPYPPAKRPTVVERGGVDINPLEPAKDALRLQAYLWPDQPERLRLTRAAIAATKTPVDKSDAIDWLQTRLSRKPGQLHLVYSTVAWQYFSDNKKAQGAAMISAAGALAKQDSPLAWFGMEADGSDKGAALTLRLWPGNLTINLGRSDFHGRWVTWSAP